MADADSDVKTTQSSAGTGATMADVAAAVRAAQAAAATTAAQAGAAGALAQEETVADVGQGEAYLVNMKRLVAQELTVDAQLQQVNIGAAQRLAVLAETALADAVALARRVNNNAVSDDERRHDNAATHDKQMDACSVSERERTVRQGDVAITTTWAALSENPVMQDAIIAGMIAAVDRYLAKKDKA